MLTIKQGIKLSAIVDKMQLEITNPEASQKEVGADLIMQLMSKAHRAEQEIYDLVAELKGCSVVEAAQVNLVEFITELTGNKDVMAFFKSAAK